MTARKKQIRYNIIAFLLLFSVSLYRQISLRYLPNDPFRTYVLYACYVSLTAAWGISIRTRVTQKSMRRFLLMEDAVIFAGLSLRFIQDTFLHKSILLMRVSGLYVAATLLPIVLFGLYAALGIGQADTYRISPTWYFLLAPVLVMLFLTVTDESHHFVCYIIPEEVQPNLYFHPYIGTYLMYGLGISFMIARVYLIYQRNNILNGRPVFRLLIPFAETIILILFTIPYFLNYLQVNPSIAPMEVIEFYAKVYYTEVLTWEFYIYMGLVPVNTDYREIFEHSTVAMQIIGKDDTRILSENASDIPADVLVKLKKETFMISDPGRELHLHTLPYGYFIWSKDISHLQETIDALKQSAEMLAQEGGLLREELKTKNEEAKLLAQNQIYDKLTGDVRNQLKLMKEIIKKQELTPDKRTLLRQLFILGTYIKRRCNLRLMQRDTGIIREEDLLISIQDMISAMKLMDIQAELNWNLKTVFSADFSIYIFDQLEYLLEYERFSINKMAINAEQKTISFSIGGFPGNAPKKDIRQMAPGGYLTEWQNMPDGYRMILREGGD